MKRLAWGVGLLALGAVLVLATRPAGASDKVPEIKEIMAKLNKPGGLRPNLGEDLQADELDWPMIQKETKQFVDLVAALGKNTPPIGGKDSWDKLTRSYLADAKAMDDAAQRKDKKGALAAHARMSSNDFCKSCHTVHQKK